MKVTLYYIKASTDSEKGHSCQDAIMELTSEILKSKELKHHAIAIFLDLSKAFDTLEHEILLAKLEKYGVRGTALSWFKSYLSNRKIRVKCNTASCANSTTSDEFEITYGTAQGSNLGPLLFILFSNDVYQVIENCKLILFADDTTMFKSHRNRKYLEFCISHDLTLLHDWFKANKLSLNLTKTVAIQFFSENSDPLKLGEFTIPFVSCTKFLGVYLDHKLKWDTQLNNVYNKIQSNSKMLRLCKNLLSQKTKLLIYNAHILSHLQYSLAVWGSMLNQEYISKIERIQTECMRYIHKSKNITPYHFTKINCLKFTQLIDLELVKTVHRAKLKTMPKSVRDIFDSIDRRVLGLKTHKYETRNKNVPNILPHKSKEFNKSFLCKSIIKYQMLDKNTKRCKKLNTFVKYVKKRLLANTT